MMAWLGRAKLYNGMVYVRLVWVRVLLSIGRVGVMSRLARVRV